MFDMRSNANRATEDSNNMNNINLSFSILLIFMIAYNKSCAMYNTSLYASNPQIIPTDLISAHVGLVANLAMQPQELTSETMVYRCLQCNPVQVLSNQKEYDKHRNKFHNKSKRIPKEGPRICHKCEPEQRFANIKTYNDHYYRNHRKNNGKSTTHKEPTFKPKVYKCLKCTTVQLFSSKKEYDRHHHEFHITKSKFHKCLKCKPGQLFTSQREYKRHYDENHSARKKRKIDNMLDTQSNANRAIEDSNKRLHTGNLPDNSNQIDQFFDDLNDESIIDQFLGSIISIPDDVAKMLKQD